uniref:Uncharacterized protein n=1 Tax=viral metagenome TaxID=1070528 RepID=A0A6C0H9B9_9ZZZZ
MSDDNMETVAENMETVKENIPTGNIPTLSDNISTYINTIINPSNNTQATTQNQHIYQITDTDILQNIVKGNVDNELGDGDHDLVRKGEETNPLIMYCDTNKEGESYINGIFVDFSFSYQGYNRSQTKIVEEMEKNIKSNTVTHKNRTITHFERTTVNIEKYMINLQKYLSDSQPDIHTTGPIPNTIIETHRGQEWDNSVTLAKMYKAKVTTRFDNPGQPDIGIGDIYDDVSELNADKNELIQRFKTSQKYDLPLLRFYPNYLPNAFSIFIRKNEINDIFKIIKPYFEKKIPPGGILDEATKIQNFLNKLHTVKEEDLLLLHMFYDNKNNKPTYSIQYGPIIANEVTYQLYGYPKRGCIRTNFGNPNMVFENENDPFMKNCHILWGKTCGDGVSIEAANMLSYLTDDTVNVLSIDECCNLRATFITGLSTCQKQSTFAGTGLGFLSTHRNVEFFKSKNIGQPIEEIYREKILGISNKPNYFNNQLELLNDLKTLPLDITIIDNFVNKFIDQKISGLDLVFSDFKNFINNNGLKQDGSFDSSTFYYLGNFNIQNYIAEIDEYRSSFTKLLNDFNTRFENIFMYNPRKPLVYNNNIDSNIELGVRFMSSIEEKLIECGMTGAKYSDDLRKQIVFTFLSTLITSIGGDKVKRYCLHLYNNILGLFRIFFTKYNIDGFVKDNYSTDVVINKDDYLYLCKTLYDKIAEIGPDETNKYKDKCIVKENINLLKFILRHQEFIRDENSPYNMTNDKKLINSKMNTNTKYSVLESKLQIYKTFYEETREKFESPTKTAQKRLRDKKRSEESNTNSSTDTSPDKSNETSGKGKKVKSDFDIGIDIIGENNITSIFTSQEFPQDNNIPSGVIIGFNEDIFDEDNFNNVFRGVQDCDDTENNLVSVEECNKINNCDDPDNLFLGVTNFISNISTLCYTAFSNIFSFTTTDVTDPEAEKLEQFEKNLEGIQKKMNENIRQRNELKGMALRSGTTVESPIYQQQMAELKRQAEDIEVEINQIIGIQQQPQESATSSSLSNANVTPEKEKGGSYFSFFSGKKGGKKSPKKQVMTRRKNKKTFKRKTMKKRKIPKRKNKTRRRLRQCK